MTLHAFSISHGRSAKQARFPNERNKGRIGCGALANLGRLSVNACSCWTVRLRTKNGIIAQVALANDWLARPLWARILLAIFERAMPVLSWDTVDGGMPWASFACREFMLAPDPEKLFLERQLASQNTPRPETSTVARQAQANWPLLVAKMTWVTRPPPQLLRVDRACDAHSAAARQERFKAFWREAHALVSS